jgi:hypothetical protein
MSASQTVRPFIYCIHLVYIYYHVSTSCIHHYVIEFDNDLRQVYLDIIENIVEGGV